MPKLPGNTFQIKPPSVFLLSVFLGFYLLGHGEVWGTDWKFLEKDDEGSWFYNSETIECLSNNMIRVRTKKIYDEKGVSKAVEKYGKDYMNLDHVLSVWEIDCLQRKFKLLSAIFHSKDNSIIQDYDDEKVKYFTLEDIPPDSYIELVRQKICK
jgi:hypothetical protein